MTFKGKRAVIACVVAACVLTLGGAATLGHLLRSYPAQPNPRSESKEEPAVTGSSLPVILGCWEVLAQGTGLSATWVPECPELPEVKQAELAWPEGIIRLPALEPGSPPMERAQTQSTLSEELALEGEGALLFLPAKADGSGYFVAGWATETTPTPRETASEEAELEDEPVRKQGLIIGRYGAPPPSIATPAGRVYLSRDWTPLGLQKNWESMPDVRYATPSQESYGEEDSTAVAP